MKIAGIIIGIILIVVLGFMIYKTIVYMVEENFTLGDAISYVWRDLINFKISNETRKNIENLASRDAEYGIQYKGLRTIE